MGELPGWWARLGRAARRDLATLAHLGRHAHARERLRAALRAPHLLTPEHRRALVLLAVAGALAAWAAGSLLLHAAGSPAARGWDLAWGLAFTAFLTTAVLPVSYEPALLAAGGSAGQVVAVAAAAVGITAGAGAVFLLGGAVRQTLEAWKGSAPLVRAFLEATERFVRAWEYGALFVLTAIPLFPDTLPVYLFSLMGLRLRPFLAAVFLGAVVRSVAVVLASRQLGLLPS